MVRSLFAVGLIQYTALTAPVSIPTPPPETPEMGDRVKAVYVHKVYARPRTVDYRSGPTVPVFVPNVTIDPLTWDPTYPDQVPRRTLPTSAHPAFSVAPFQPPASFASGGQIIATGSIRTLLQYQALSAPLFAALAGSGDLGVPPLSVYPSRVERPSFHSSRQQAWAFDKFTAPTAPTVPDIQPAQSPMPVRRPYRQAVYERLEPIFGYVVPVPVMSWTGVYLDPPVRRAVRFQPEPKPFPIDYDTTINPPAPLFSWTPEHPDRLDRPKSRIHLFAARTDALYVPEVTTGAAPALSWKGQYADRVPAKRALRTGQHPAFFFDRFAAPTPVIAPDMAAPVYVNRVYGRPPNTHHPSLIAPEFVPDVTNPVGGIEWLAIYPDRIDRETLPVYAKLSWTGLIWSTELVPAAVIHEIEGRGSYARKIFGKGSYDPTLRGKGSL